MEGENVQGKHWYDGVYFNAGFPVSAIEKVKNMDFHQDDLLIATYPKAGTTWMQEIAYLISTEGDFDGAKSSIVLARSPFIEMDIRGEGGDRHYNGLDILARKDRPCNLKTHLHYRFLEKAFQKVKPKVIVVMRNLKDNLVSYYHFYRMIKEFHFDDGFNKFFSLVQEKNLVHGDWFDFNLGWWEHKDDPNILFVTYEDMKKDIRSVINKVCHFLNKTLTPELIDAIIDHTSFGKMKTNPMVNYEFFAAGMDFTKSSFMRKGQVGDWKNHFTQEENDVCNRLLEEKLAGTGLDEIYKPSEI